MNDGVVISNFAVAWWFERSNELQNESSLTERIVDRAVGGLRAESKHAAVLCVDGVKALAKAWKTVVCRASP